MPPGRKFLEMLAGEEVIRTLPNDQPTHMYRHPEISHDIHLHLRMTRQDQKILRVSSRGSIVAHIPLSLAATPSLDLGIRIRTVHLPPPYFQQNPHKLREYRDHRGTTNMEVKDMTLPRRRENTDINLVPTAGDRKSTPTRTLALPQERHQIILPMDDTRATETRIKRIVDGEKTSQLQELVVLLRVCWEC
jgi:hypothetical protein